MNGVECIPLQLLPKGPLSNGKQKATLHYLLFSEALQVVPAVLWHITSLEMKTHTNRLTVWIFPESFLLFCVL